MRRPGIPTRNQRLERFRGDLHDLAIAEQLPLSGIKTKRSQFVKAVRLMSQNDSNREIVEIFESVCKGLNSLEAAQCALLYRHLAPIKSHRRIDWKCYRISGDVCRSNSPVAVGSKTSEAFPGPNENAGSGLKLPVVQA